MTKQELEFTVQEIKRYKMIVEEATNIQKSLEMKIINHMTENFLTEETTDTSKISYKSQNRETLDKDKLREKIGDLKDYTKVTVYSVLRIR